MAFCMAELHLWSTKSSLRVKDTDIGTYQFYDKVEPGAAAEHHYYGEKLDFCEGRGYSWIPRNRRPERLRDSLKELEELLHTNTCVHTRWRTKHCCQVMLSNGVLVTLHLNGPQLDRVCIDRTLVGRLPASTVTDAVLSERLLLLSFLEQSQVAAVYLGHKNPQDSPERRSDKLSPSDIKISCLELGQSQGRRLRRRVCWNRLQEVALCWWDPEESAEEAWPWSPAHSKRNNLVLLSCSPTEGLKVLCSVRTKGNPLDCCFSLLQPQQLLTVESTPPDGRDSGSWSAAACVYDCGRDRLRRLSVTSIPLPSRPVCCSRHPDQVVVLLGLSDSSLVLHDQRRGVSLLAPCPVTPALLAWHPAGALVAAVGRSNQGDDQLVCFDVGLAPVGVALLAEEEGEETSASTLRLAQHVRCSGGLEALGWASDQEGSGGATQGTDTLLLTFHGGPVGALKFKLGVLGGGGGSHMGPRQLLQQRLRCEQVREALGILEAMDWSTMGDECLRALGSVANHLLRLELSAEREAQLEAALGVFYAPPLPHSDDVLQEYTEPISKYARRFFHHLLRHERFEKAFLLAVDLQARDLFMDLHYVASDKGEVVLADVAKRKANEIQAQVVAASEDPVGSRNTHLSASSLEQRKTNGNQSETGPSYPGTPTMHTDGPANQRRPEDNIVPLMLSPGWLRTLRQAGRSECNREDSTEAQQAEMLHVVHLGRV